MPESMRLWGGVGTGDRVLRPGQSPAMGPPKGGTGTAIGIALAASPPPLLRALFSMSAPLLCPLLFTCCPSPVGSPMLSSQLDPGGCRTQTIPNYSAVWKQMMCNNFLSKTRTNAHIRTYQPAQLLSFYPPPLPNKMHWHPQWRCPASGQHTGGLEGPWTCWSRSATDERELAGRTTRKRWTRCFGAGGQQEAWWQGREDDEGTGGWEHREEMMGALPPCHACPVLFRELTIDLRGEGGHIHLTQDWPRELKGWYASLR